VSEGTLEERVTNLERLVDTLLHRADTAARKKDWRRTLGMFDEDRIMKEIIDEGQRIRQKDRRKADP